MEGGIIVEVVSPQVMIVLHSLISLKLMLIEEITAHIIIMLQLNKTDIGFIDKILLELVNNFL